MTLTFDTIHHGLITVYLDDDQNGTATFHRTDHDTPIRSGVFLDQWAREFHTGYKPVAGTYRLVELAPTLIAECAGNGEALPRFKPRMS